MWLAAFGPRISIFMLLRNYSTRKSLKVKPNKNKFALGSGNGKIWVKFK